MQEDNKPFGSGFHYLDGHLTPISFERPDEVILTPEKGGLQWLSTSGGGGTVAAISKKNGIDDFIAYFRLERKYRNQIIDLANNFFVALQIVEFNGEAFDSAHVGFVIGDGFLWTIHTSEGDPILQFRNRLMQDPSVLDGRDTYYLLYLCIQELINLYGEVHEEIERQNEGLDDLSKVVTTKAYALKLEAGKKNLFVLKKSFVSLREVLSKLVELHRQDEKGYKYYVGLREQVNFHIDDIDIDFQELESGLNLMFNMQSFKMNRVMQTLTIFSVLFTPPAFFAGVYGMNFPNMPELQWTYGYLIFWIVVSAFTIVSVIYMRKQQLFEK